MNYHGCHFEDSYQYHHRKYVHLMFLVCLEVLLVLINVEEFEEDDERRTEGECELFYCLGAQ